MNKIPFDEKELKVVSETKNFRGQPLPLYDFPVTPKEAYTSFYRDKAPVWMPTDVESTTLCPSIIPDNIARAFVFVPHLLEDVNDWEEKIQWPDIESWDWEASGELNKPLKENGKATVMMWLNGMGFERLVSFMGFENAALALVDEDQEDALKALLHKLTDLYIALVDKSVQYYDVDGFSLHDDWGSQKAPFFSEEAGRKFFLPEMKRYNDHIHSLGKFTDLHSCGHIEDRCGIFADAGFDSWTPMPMNDTIALYEKYGDRIAIGVVNDEPFDPAVATEDEQRAAARKYAQRFTKPGKLGFWSGFYNAPGQMTPAFREELYKTTRELYAE